MKKCTVILVYLLANLFVASSALSHPHMFMDTTAGFKLDGNNQLKSIVLRFVVDELNTTYTIATLDLDKDGDGKFSVEDKNKVATSVIKGFAHYDYFTYLQNGQKNVPLKAPTYSTVDFVNGQLVIAMEIFLRDQIAVSGKTFTLKLYDPTYFTEVTIKETPRIIGGSKQCRVKLDKAIPDENSSKLQTLLAKLSREETPELENVGALFADKTRLACAG